MLDKLNVVENTPNIHTYVILINLTTLLDWLNWQRKKESILTV